MSIIQKIFKFTLPRKYFYFDKIETESKKWFFVCDDCGYEKSVWDAGGLRFSATPKKKPVAGKCPQCGKIGVMHLTKKS